jgi:hypothetical protein
VITDADINEFTSDANQKNKLSLADIKNRRIQNGVALTVRRRQRGGNNTNPNFDFSRVKPPVMNWGRSLGSGRKQRGGADWKDFLNVAGNLQPLMNPFLNNIPIIGPLLGQAGQHTGSIARIASEAGKRIGSGRRSQQRGGNPVVDIAKSSLGSTYQVGKWLMSQLGLGRRKKLRKY